MKRPDWHPIASTRLRVARGRRRASAWLQRAVIKFGLLDAVGLSCFIVAGFLWHVIAGWIVAGTSLLVMSYRLGGNE